MSKINLRLLKKFMATLLVVVLFSQSTLFALTPNIGYTDEHTVVNAIIDPSIWVAEILEIQAEMLESWGYWEATREPLNEAIVSAMSVNVLDEVDVIHGMSSEAFENLPTGIQHEIVHIDMLAAMIFNFYEQYGFFPDEDEFSDYLSRRRNSMTIDDTVLMFLLKGFQTTAFAVANAIAQIGAGIGLAFPIPAIQAVALVAGTTIVAGGGILLAMAATVFFSAQIAQTLHWMLANNPGWNPAIAQANIWQTDMVDQARRSGHEHFRARRALVPSGGIVIGHPFNNIAEAAGHLAMGQGHDTFSSSFALAGAVATASTGFQPYLDRNPHNSTNQPLNLPHFHPLRGTNSSRDRISSHAWFPF